MHYKLKNYIGLIVISVFFLSCNRNPLSKVDFSKEGYKMYFYAYPDKDNKQNYNSFYSKYKNFYISDNSILENIKKNIILKKYDIKTINNSLYAVKLIQNGKVLDVAVLDVVNGMILSYSGNYKFDIKKLEKYNSSFKTLNSYQVNCVTISNIKKFITFIESSNGFIFLNSEDDKNPFVKFNGVVKLKTDTSNVDFSKGSEIFKNRFISDFKKLGDIAIISSKYNGKDSINLTMLWENDYTLNMPTGYRLTKQYTDTFDFPLYVYDIKEKEILSFFKDLGINGYTVTNLNK